jgi:hypothetical protein
MWANYILAAPFYSTGKKKKKKKATANRTRTQRTANSQDIKLLEGDKTTVSEQGDRSQGRWWLRGFIPTASCRKIKRGQNRASQWRLAPAWT